MNRKELEEAVRLNQSLKSNIAALTKEIEIHKQKTALAEQETYEMGRTLQSNYEKRVAALENDYQDKLAQKTSEFDQANEAIKLLQEEVEELNTEVQAQMDKTFSLQQTMNGIPETFKMDRDDSPMCSPCFPAMEETQQATSSKEPSKPLFYPSVSQSGLRGPAVSAEEAARPEWGGWHPKDNPATSHGFTDRASYEEALRLNRELFRKQAIAEQVVPFVDQIVTSSKDQQDGAATPTLSAIPAPGNLPFGKKTSERIYNWRMAIHKRFYSLETCLLQGGCCSLCYL